MNRSAAIASAALLLTVIVLPAVTAQAAEKPAAPKVAKETWDWPKAMIEVASKFKGEPGVVMHVGDSTTRNNHATKWVRTVRQGRAPGLTASDKAILKWSHADKDESDKNGWQLSVADVNDMRTNTAAKNLTTDGLLKGGPGELPPLKKLLATYKPQVVFLLVGVTDAARGRDAQAVAADMGKALDAITATGAVPVLTMLPPNKPAMAAVKAINAKFLSLAAKKKVPVVDLYGEILARRPGDSWVGTLTNKDGRRLSIDVAEGPPTKENLAKGGYLLRSWLVVQKLKEVKAKVLDKAKK